MSFSIGFCLCVTLLFQLHLTFSASNPTGLTLRAVLDDSPDSPLYLIENLTESERIERFISITNARANDHLNQTWSLDDARVDDSVNARIPLLRERLFYAVEFTIGSQHQRVKLLMDTGGSLTWTQCQACIKCFDQKLPKYSPTSSATHRFLPCDHPLCLQGTGKPFACVNGVCTYVQKYIGGTSSSGIASSDTFHFPTGSINDIIFGCSIKSTNVPFQNTDISGIFGLDMSPESLTSQMNPSRFSYCLVPYRNSIPRPLVLRFGEDVPRLAPQQSRITSFVTIPGIPHFYLQLNDISVANVPLRFPPNTFQVRPNKKGGCIIDSGCLYTVIDTGNPGSGLNPYERVLQAFEEYYRAKGLIRRTRENLDLCYELPVGYNDFASLTFHFNGAAADYTVNGQYVHVFKSGSFCVAITGKDVGTILGAWHQQDKRIIYDLGRKGLQFADEQCINDVP